MTLFNFHTHNIKERNGIINCFPSDAVPEAKYISCGMHPWHYSKNYDLALKIVDNLAKDSKIVAVGETGFDPKSRVSIDMQSEIFERHADISEKYKLPLIIHCVKFFNNLISIKNKLNPESAWVIHGFNGKASIASELVKHGFYFSISEKILMNKEKATEIINIIPIEKILFETDDHDSDISNIYNFAAKIYGLSLNEMKIIIDTNLKRIGI